MVEKKRTIATKQELEPRITWLAITETTIVCSVSAWIFLSYGSAVHIAFGASIAPLLLLKSPQSIELALKWYRKLFKTLDSYCHKVLNNYTRVMTLGSLGHILLLWAYVVLLEIAYYMLLILGSFCIRFCATIRFPLKGLRLLPSNWKKIVLCTDLRTPSELVPGGGPIPHFPYFLGFRIAGNPITLRFMLFLLGVSLIIAITIGVCMDDLRGIERYIDSVLYTIKKIITLTLFISLSVYIAVSSHLVSYIYRLSLKSTFLVWAPLLYTVKVTFNEDLSLTSQIKVIKTSALWRLTRAFAWCTLLAMGFKVFALPRTIDMWNSFYWSKFANIFVMPNIVHPWHIASTMNAILALVYFYFVIDKAQMFVKEGVWQKKNIKTTLQIFTFIRSLISYYTIAVGIILAYRAASLGPWPAFVPQFWP